MKLVSMICPHCNAKLKVAADSERVICEHCGAEFLIDDEVKHIQYDNAEAAGYAFEKGRQRAKAEAKKGKARTESAEPVSEPVKSEPEPKKKKRFPWWIVIVVLLLILVFRGGSGNSKSGTQITATETVQTKAPETVQATAKPAESDLSIITREGHPKYYGSTAQAHKTWSDIKEKGRIIFADSFDKYSDATILVMSGYNLGEKNEIIRDLEIYFHNFKDGDSYDLQTALDVAKDYFPRDIVDKWYEYNGSRKIVSKEPGEKDTYYTVSYRLTDKGKEGYYAKEHQYSGSMDIIIQESKDGGILNMGYSFGTPKWMGFLDKNGYTSEEWSYDFLSE